MDNESTEPRYCQSCIQRLTSSEQHGMNADGSINYDYCGACWQDGMFTSPEMTMEQMLDIRAPIMVNVIIDPGKGRELLREWLSGLKRWRAE